MGLHAELVPKHGLFIDGHWVEPLKGKRIPIVNPTTEEPVGDIPAATSEDVDAAVKAAKDAFYRNKGQDWAKASGKHRATFLRAIAKRVAERKSELAKLESIDCGKPIDEAEWDLDDVSGCFEYYADLAEKLDERQGAPVELPMEQFKCNVRREAMGVVGLITPWNYPLLMATWKVAAALAAGCTAILKPSEMASVTCLELASIAADVGLPRGVLNVITGYGQEAGAPLALHPGVDKVSFTGSTNTGRSIMSGASQLIKPVTLELGGKSPLIVFDDADVDKAVEWAMFGAFWTNGQICSATSRLLLQEGIADEFLKKIATWASSIKVSDPLEKDCRLGPLVSESQYKKVKEFVRVAQEEGATLVCGGKRPDHLTKGFFLAPTVISNVKPHMQIWTDEVFGPVLAVSTFKTEEEALAMANDTQYGLAGAVISKDEDRCKRVSEGLEVGIVWINCSQPCFCQAPWGGNKRSGFGRELGEWGLENYLSVKQMDEVRFQDSSISKSIDLYLEELKREQAAREKLNVERDRSENDRSGNGAMSLSEREGAGEEEEEDWEEEYAMLDLDDVFHGAPVPSFTYTLSGLDTLNPILTLDNGLKLIGHYVETIGTAVVYSEKENEAQADRWELPPPADPNAVNKEKRPLKRIRGVCKLERKLKFCAMPIAYAPARNDTSVGDTSFMRTAGADDASLVNAMQTQGALPTDNASLGDARLKEDESLESARPPENGPPENAVLTEDELLRNGILIYNTSAESAKLGEDVSLDSMRPADDAPSENARSMEDVSLENARPEVNTTLEYARAVEDVSLENAMPTEDTSK